MKYKFSYRFSTKKVVLVNSYCNFSEILQVCFLANMDENQLLSILIRLVIINYYLFLSVSFRWLVL